METVKHEEGMEPRDVLKAVGELCVMYWHEKRGTTRQWVANICRTVDDNLQDLGGEQ